jgi:serine/threonine protein kinase
VSRGSGERGDSWPVSVVHDSPIPNAPRFAVDRGQKQVLPLSDMEDPPTEDFDEIYMYSPLFDRDLSRVISSGAALADEHVKYFVWQMCCGLHYIHSASILHRDMKPANCLVTTSCDLALCDFGLARYVDARDDVGGAMTEYVVTRWFRPPELVLTQMYTAAVDMWGLGCIFAQLLGRKPLFPGRDFKDQVEVICSIIGKPTEEQMAHIDSPRAREFVSKLPDVPPVSFKALFPDAPDDALHLLAGLLRFAPGERLTAAEALKHPYLEEYVSETAVYPSPRPRPRLSSNT